MTARSTPVHDEDLFDFSQVALARLPTSVRETRLPAPPVAGETTSLSTPALWPRLLPWIGAQAAASIMLAACVAQAMPQTAPPTESDVAEFVLRLDGETVVAPLPASLEDGFRLRLTRQSDD